MQTVELCLHHEAALASFLADFDAAGEESIPAYFPPHDAPIADAVRDVAAWSRGERLKPGWTACTTLFVEEDGELLGVVNLRHELDERLRAYGGNIGYSVRPSARGRGVGHRCLAAGMQRARELGLHRVLISCEPSNVPSWKVIERAGGVIEDERWYEPAERLVRRYWIDL